MYAVPLILALAPLLVSAASHSGSAGSGDLPATSPPRRAPQGFDTADDSRREDDGMVVVSFGNEGRAQVHPHTQPDHDSKEESASFQGDEVQDDESRHEEQPEVYASFWEYVNHYDGALDSDMPKIILAAMNGTLMFESGTPSVKEIIDAVNAIGASSIDYAYRWGVYGVSQFPYVTPYAAASELNSGDDDDHDFDDQGSALQTENPRLDRDADAYPRYAHGGHRGGVQELQQRREVDNFPVDRSVFGAESAMAHSMLPQSSATQGGFTFGGWPNRHPSAVQYGAPRSDDMYARRQLQSYASHHPAAQCSCATCGTGERLSGASGALVLPVPQPHTDQTRLTENPRSQPLVSATVGGRRPTEDDSDGSDTSAARAPERLQSALASPLDASRAPAAETAAGGSPDAIPAAQADD